MRPDPIPGFPQNAEDCAPPRNPAIDALRAVAARAKAERLFTRAKMTERIAPLYEAFVACR